MDSKRLHELDAALEGALHSERMRPAPLGLRRRVQSRVQYIAMQDRERRHFRSAVLAAFGLFAGAVGAVGLALWQFGLPYSLVDESPGFQGQFDRLMVGFLGSEVVLLALGCVVAGAFTAAALIGLLPWLGGRRARRS